MGSSCAAPQSAVGAQAHYAVSLVEWQGGGHKYASCEHKRGQYDVASDKRRVARDELKSEPESEAGSRKNSRSVPSE